MSAEHDHEHERTGHKTSRLQPTHNKGWCFATVTLGYVAHRWVPARTPTVHRCFHGGRPGVARHKLHETTHDKRQHDRQGLETNVLSAKPGVDTHGNLHGSGAASRNRSPSYVNEHVVLLSKWIRPGSSRRWRREAKPINEENITQEKINQETEDIKIPEESTH